VGPATIRAKIGRFVVAKEVRMKLKDSLSTTQSWFEIGPFLTFWRRIFF